MLNKLSLCFLFWVLPFFVEAQIHRAYTRADLETELHIKSGWQAYSLTGSSFATQSNSGWLAGVAFKVPIRYRWWVQPEILFSRRSASLLYPESANAGAHTVRYDFSYVTYPILFIFKPNDLIEVQLGPQFAVLMNYSGTAIGHPGAVELQASDINRWDYAAAAGLELNVSPLAFGIRYAYGLRQLAITEQARELLGTASLSGLQVYGALVF